MCEHFAHALVMLPSTFGHGDGRIAAPAIGLWQSHLRLWPMTN
jgi:hypothetical protein